MKIYLHNYKLRPMGNWSNPQSGHSGEGALLKIEFPDGRVGYSDLHPWPSLGDEPIEQQIQLLKKGRITPLAEQSIWFANRDSQVRLQKKNALTDLTKVKNHYFVPGSYHTSDTTLDEVKTAGFTILKIKVGVDLENEINWLNRITKKYHFRYRLDFGSKLDYHSYARYMSFFEPDTLKRIEFVEDPCPYDRERWSELKKIVPLAVDREFEAVGWEGETKDLPFGIVILKPAVQDVEKIHSLCMKHRLQLVVTSYLDHPVGVIHAAWIAGELKKKTPLMLLDCGLMSFPAYAYSDWVSLVKIHGPFIFEAMGVGIGFDYLLEKAEWKPLMSF